LDLFSAPTEIRGKTTGQDIRNDFTDTVKSKGGSRDAIAKSTEKMTHNLFDCGTDQLYEETGGKKGDRTSLPRDAQTAYGVGETIARHDLNQTDISGNQQQRDTQIVDTVDDSSKRVRKLFPW
jgi:hypothetical protein